jgi:hypothetical protein
VEPKKGAKMFVNSGSKEREVREKRSRKQGREYSGNDVDRVDEKGRRKGKEHERGIWNIAWPLNSAC